MKHTLYRDDKEIQVEVNYSISGGERGNRIGGVQMEPDYGPEVMIESVKDADGIDYTASLTNDEVVEIESAAWKDVED